MRYLWLTGTKVKYEYHMSCRTKTIEAMRSCRWRLFSYSHCSAAFCLFPGAKKKISCTRWFLNLPSHVCLVLSLAIDKILMLICKFSSRTPWPPGTFAPPLRDFRLASSLLLLCDGREKGEDSIWYFLQYFLEASIPPLALDLGILCPWHGGGNVPSLGGRLLQIKCYGRTRKRFDHSSSSILPLSCPTSCAAREPCMWSPASPPSCASPACPCHCPYQVGLKQG